MGRQWVLDFRQADRSICHFLLAEITAVGGTLSAVATQLANYHELSESLEFLMSAADAYKK